MIIGAHILLQSRNDKADQAFLTQVLKLSSVDAGEGFLIFGLPPSEVAVHTSDQNDIHQLHLMCEDIEEFVAEMEELGIDVLPPADRGWGTVTEVTMPGGGKLSVYEPHHKRPKAKAQAARKKAPGRKAAKKATKKASKEKKGKKDKKKKKKKAKRR